MGNFVLIAGTYFGSWYWDELAANLRSHGHTVFAPTLPGLLPEESTGVPINLDTHIDFVVDHILANDLNEVVVAGWSYGGMVVTGVADRVNSRIKKLVYLDAMVPKPGQSEFDLITPALRDQQLAEAKDGISAYPSADFLAWEPRMRPHPLATKIQPLHYDQAAFDSLSKVFIFGEQWFGNPAEPSLLKPIYERIQDEPGWLTESWPNGHNLYGEDPERVEALLVDCLL